MRYILDASAILCGKDLPSTDELVLPPLVEDELGHAWARRKLEYLKGTCLRVQSPSEAALEDMRAAARRTGDDARLSEADLQVLALARELGATILSDDYSIQNLARELDIPYQAISQGGIRRTVRWEYRCRGCGRYFPEAVKECPVCGHPVKSSAPRGERRSLSTPSRKAK